MKCQYNVWSNRCKTENVNIKNARHQSKEPIVSSILIKLPQTRVAQKV